MGTTKALWLGLAGLVGLAGTARGQQQEGAFRWYLGAQGGVIGFQTPNQTRAWIPTAGGSLLVNAKRTGLMITVDEAFGNDELTGFADNTAGNGGVRQVTFQRIRKYSAVLTGYPFRSRTAPYFGLGYGIMQVLDPQPVGPFPSAVSAAISKDDADQRSADGFISFVAGVQARGSRWTIFGQYQLSSAAGSGHLLRGPVNAFTGGLRFSLGNAREGVKGGGY
jgi:hypothetical protein